MYCRNIKIYKKKGILVVYSNKATSSKHTHHMYVINKYIYK